MATCIFKHFDFLEKIKFENGKERIFDGSECNFYEENLKTALFCNTLIYKLKGTCSPRLILVSRLYNVWNLLKEKTNEFIEKTDHTMVNQISLYYILYAFFKIVFRTRFP